MYYKISDSFQNFNSGKSPQANKIQFSVKYFECDPDLLIFTTANWIKPMPKEQQKKFSTRDFLSGTIERFKSAIVPSSVLMGSVGNNTSRKEIKGKKNKQQASSQFYDIADDITDSCNNTKNSQMERNKKEMTNVMNHDNEEFKQSIENREKSLERRPATTNTVYTQTQPQGGILKNKLKDQIKTTPSAMLKVDGPEIVVIDDVDIDESMRNESKILVFEKEPTQVDLCHLLGSDWPNIAGEQAMILNKLQSTNLTQQHSSVNSNCGSTSDNIQIANKSNRSKSSNPLLHLGANISKKSNDSISFNNKNSDNKKMQSKFLFLFFQYLPLVELYIV